MEDGSSPAEPLPMVGEDAASFDVKQQTTQSWALFTVLLTGVLGLIYLVGGTFFVVACMMTTQGAEAPPCSAWTKYGQSLQPDMQPYAYLSDDMSLCVRVHFWCVQVWIQPGVGLADDYLSALEGLSSNNPELTIVLILGVFALFHSGLAGLRPKGEQQRGSMHGDAQVWACMEVHK